MTEIKNVRGGGLSYISDFDAPDCKLFVAGNKSHSVFNDRLTYKTLNHPDTYHDRMNYERGIIYHSRSNTNQFLLFHWLYGGPKKYFIDRLFKNHIYRKQIRLWWLPALTMYTLGCLTMRMYENGCHDYFYFSE